MDTRIPPPRPLDDLAQPEAKSGIPEFETQSESWGREVEERQASLEATRLLEVREALNPNPKPKPKPKPKPNLKARIEVEKIKEQAAMRQHPNWKARVERQEAAMAKATLRLGTLKTLTLIPNPNPDS